MAVDNSVCHKINNNAFNNTLKCLPLCRYFNFIVKRITLPETALHVQERWEYKASKNGRDLFAANVE